VQQRDLEPADASTPIDDWTTASITTIAERQRDGLPLGPQTELFHNLVLQAPAGLTGNARMVTLTAADRDTSGSLVPPTLLDDPQRWGSFSLMPVREAAAPLDVLELTDVQGGDSVTRESPLVLRLPTAVPDDETVLVLAFDGRNYLPVGQSVREEEVDGARAPTTTVRIEMLPQEGAVRSLGGAVRLLFRRFWHRLTGVSQTETRLALPSYDPATEEVSYLDDVSAVRAAVASADRVLLLVHGIIGDTRGMVVASHVLAPGAADSFASRYDAVLTFDFESVSTPIAQTAEALAIALASAGLDDDGTTLDIVAHSMGGLISRWMIEILDGPPPVSRLVTAGTPNGGSPWPRAEDLAISALSLGLNGLAAVAWPAGILGALLKLIEKVDTGLDDMTPGSATLTTLAGAPDPGIPYIAIVGDRALSAPPAPGSRLQALFAALSGRITDAAARLAFLDSVNDLAVSQDSAGSLPANRQLVDFRPGVACDHLTYFESTAGRTALNAALAENATAVTSPIPQAPVLRTAT
jgi:hypothetical protein